MFVEWRTYQLKVGTSDLYMEVYRALGYPVQRKYLGEPVGFFQSEHGELNEIAHMWRYESLDERANRRNALFADPAWHEFLKASWPMVVSQQSVIYRQAALSEE